MARYSCDAAGQVSGCPLDGSLGVRAAGAPTGGWRYLLNAAAAIGRRRLATNRAAACPPRKLRLRHDMETSSASLRIRPHAVDHQLDWSTGLGSAGWWSRPTCASARIRSTMCG